MIDREPDDCTTITTWNVNGIQSCADTGAFERYVRLEDATMLVVTETNCKGDFLNIQNKAQFVWLKEMYRYRYWTPLVLVCSKVKPLRVVHGFALAGDERGKGLDEEECRQRCIALEFESAWLVGVYVPHSSKGTDRRRAWNSAFTRHVRELDASKPVICTGDFNVVFANDTSRPQPDHTAGATAEERDDHRRFLGPDPAQPKSWRSRYHKFVDVWRLMNGDDAKGGYTYRSDRFGSWRLDLFVVSERYLANIRKCRPRPDVATNFAGASDHWPVWMSLEVAPEEL